MSDIIISTDPMAGWLILAAHGRWWLGKPKEQRRKVLDGNGKELGTAPERSGERVTLSPVYEVIHVIGVLRGGDVEFQHTVTPVLCFPGITELIFHEPTVIGVDVLPIAIRLGLRQGVEKADKMHEQLRMRAAGIPTNMPLVPHG